MTQQEKFNETVGILVKAYLNDTLEHGNCSACAVGNIIAAKMGTETILSCHIKNGDVYRWTNGIQSMWQRVFITPHYTVPQVIRPEELHGDAADQIKSSGYHWEELAKIESAFETTPAGGDRMFNGLMNVVDVLAEIHSIDLTAKENAKLLFVK